MTVHSVHEGSGSILVWSTSFTLSLSLLLPYMKVEPFYS